MRFDKIRKLMRDNIDLNTELTIPKELPNTWENY